MLKAVLFDLFGTVVAYGDVATGTRLAWEGIYRVLRRMGASVPYEEFAPFWQDRLITPLAPDEDVAETPFLSKLLHLFKSYGLAPDREILAEAAQSCLAGWDTHLNLPEDTIPTLHTLRRRYGLGLVSNFDHPPYVRELLQRLDLTRCFDYVVISGDIRIDKPDPRIYRMALDALGCAPKEAAFVGDTPSTDIAGAITVGCRPILIDMDNRYPNYAGERIRRLADLIELLAE